MSQIKSVIWYSDRTGKTKRFIYYGNMSSALDALRSITMSLKIITNTTEFIGNKRVIMSLN